jgi:hypothetical protein
MTLTVCWSAKGGTGTTIVAACWALETTNPSVLVDIAGDLHLALGIPTPSGQGLSDWFESDAPPRSVLDLALQLDTTTRLIPRGPAPIPHRAPRWAELGRWMTASDLEFIADAGLGPTPAGFPPGDSAVDGVRARARSLLVTRACYIALSRAQSLGETPDGIVLVEESGRGLSADDIARALRAPIVAKIAYDPLIGRATDRGLLAGKLPRSIHKLPQRVA